MVAGVDAVTLASSFHGDAEIKDATAYLNDVSCWCIFWGFRPSKMTRPNSPFAEGSTDEGKTASKSENPSLSQWSSKGEEELLSSSTLRKFSFNDLKVCTRNFRPDSILGEGGFGCVFKGWIDEHGTAPAKPGTGLTVAVKTLNQSGLQGHKEWLAELNFLGQLSHPNLVKLIGYCIENDQRLLVYEFLQKGSLENHLFRRGALPIPWNTRVNIALGAARGLAFLHSGETPIIYRDFKSSNILLDDEFNAKLSDFGLARDGPECGKSHVSTRVLGTYGYAAPEYVMTGHLTTKSDVYSYGVVLMELLTAKRCMDKKRPSGQHNLVEWARPQLSDKKRIYKILDPGLDGHYSTKELKTIAYLAYRCTSRDTKSRPHMTEVVSTLESLLNTNDSSSHAAAVATATATTTSAAAAAAPTTAAAATPAAAAANRNSNNNSNVSLRGNPPPAFMMPPNQQSIHGPPTDI